MSMSQLPADDDPFAAFELPPDIMGATFEHAISDVEGAAHERGHAIARALQKKLKGSIVEYNFPGMITAHMASGAVARCGGPAIGWMIDVEKKPGASPITLDVDVPDEGSDPGEIAKALAKALKKY